MAHAGGRPPKLTPEEREEVYNALANYISETKDPTLPDFESNNETAIKYNINDSNLYDWSEFSVLIKRTVRKQEAYLLRNGGKEYNATMAIFRLKQPQHGYRDRTETDVTTGGDKLSPVLVRFIDSGTDARNTDTSGV